MYMFFANYVDLGQTLQNAAYNMVIMVEYTIDFRYLKFQVTLWNTSKYPYLDISDLQNWGKK